MKRSSKNFIPIEQEKYYDGLYREKKFGELRSLLLDSSLITATHFNYSMKIIECGDYIQFYYFNKIKSKKGSSSDKKIDEDNLYKTEETYNKKNDLKTIEYKNILRSKFQLQRIVKSNEEEFKTFLTLTFAENLGDVELANKKFAIWRTKVKSIFKDFKYVCVPEFQKRGSVHYHLLTNIEIDKIYNYSRRGKKLETQLIIPQNNTDKHQYDVKFWSYGFTSVFPMKDINVVGYITKYMTKDIDNRLFGFRRYLNSNNLVKPKEHYVDISSDKDFLSLLERQNKSEEIYKGSYYSFEGDVIDFVEYKIKKGE